MAMRGPRQRQVIGGASWISEERASASQIQHSEVEEFTFSARNDVDWLNEHMAEIFSENQINVAEIFKTPGKLRGRTPRTARKVNVGEARVPLSNIFSSTPKGTPNLFVRPNLNQGQPHKLKVAEDKQQEPAPKQTNPSKAAPSRQTHPSKPAVPAADSGYHGSQSQQDPMEIDELAMDTEQLYPSSPKRPVDPKVREPAARQMSPELGKHASPTQPTIEPTFHSAKEEQTMTAKVLSPPPVTMHQPIASPMNIRPPSPVRKPVPPPKSSPVKSSSPQKSSPAKAAVADPVPEPANQSPLKAASPAGVESEEIRSPSDGSSPIRPVVRKSSMNFASLPAREPLTSKMSLGGRISRTSHLHNRHTGGKSMGATRRESLDDDHDEMEIDEDLDAQNTTEVTRNIAAHNKTYTQRLQDQISMLGKSQSNGARPSKSLANNASQHATTPYSQPVQPPEVSQQVAEQKLSVSPRKQESIAAPGAFPNDEEDDWIAPPESNERTLAITTLTSPRPAMPKSYSTDVMEEVLGKGTVGGSEFVLPKQRQHDPASHSPQRAPAIPERSTSIYTHGKSASVPFLPNMESELGSPKKAISVSNPTLATVSESDRVSTTPSKSPSRTFRDSPLKQVKNKLSSILKSSKGLLASSAAISAEGKSSLLSPSTTRLGFHAGPSAESLAMTQNSVRGNEFMYPDLSQHHAVAPQSPSRPESPSRSPSRRTRASAEREKREQKQKDKETKEAQRMADQMGKLEKMREKEREKARVFSEEQEKATTENQLAAPNEWDGAVQQTPVAAKEPARPTRTSPRKAKAQIETGGQTAATVVHESKMADGDVDMADVPQNMPPPALPRSTAPNQANRSVKRPFKPSKEPPSKMKQAPTVIRVNTTSSQHSHFHPPNSVLGATLHDTLGPQPPQQLKTKASTASLQTKPSLQSLKSSVSSTGRPKALDLAAKRKEQEERDAQRKKEAKAEMDRKRAALQEEERRQEEQRRLDAQRQKEREREQVAAQAEAKKSAQRQAAIEKAKQTRAPPPAPRSQQNAPPDYNLSRNDAGPPRPPSRLNSTMHRSQEEPNRPVNAILSNSTKAPPKRQLQPEANEDGARPGLLRNGPSYQSKDAKRMRMSEDFDEDDLEMGGQSNHSKIKGPPVRPSGGPKKELPTKSLFPTGYANAPASVTRDLFKSTVTAQHNGQAKTTHPLDMAQVSKGAIPFAPNPNPAGQSSHKTPARPAGTALPGKSAAKSAAKSATRSSPRFVNGEAIELPEIQTDDEDSDDDAHVGIAPWANSPDLRKALMGQETIDPLQVFGPAGALNMEEVFSRHKDRWQKFRARTSSANWSGSDRLTEDDIRKDLAARDKMRREGGWSYELSKDVL